ncbi:MAG TPA: hypothetical protein VKS44_08605 [Candidatus Acidoferrales bacterium]|nr:hypothetical protein [Candidatus Acidoferrales bacterium]
MAADATDSYAAAIIRALGWNANKLPLNGFWPFFVIPAVENDHIVRELRGANLDALTVVENMLPPEKELLRGRLRKHSGFLTVLDAYPAITK